jgi:transposase InsO family protein
VVHKTGAGQVDMIENYIRYYNNQRVQRNLGILTPIEKHNLYLAA